MARTGGRASGAAVAAACLALVACGPGGPVTDPMVSGVDAAAREKTSACLDAKDLGELAWGETRIADDNVNGERANTGCSTGRTEFYRFTLDERSAVYADAFGSAISTAGGFAPAPCGSAPLACGLGLCAEPQLQLFEVLPAGTWNLFVAGATSRDFGEFVLHVHRERVSANALGEIPPGAEPVERGFASFSGGNWGCGWSLYAWGYYLTCPEDPGGTVTVSACTACSTLRLGWLDTEGGGVCEPVDDPDAACGLRSTLEGEDVGGAGLHLVYVSAQVMSPSSVHFTLDVDRL